MRETRRGDDRSRAGKCTHTVNSLREREMQGRVARVVDTQNHIASFIFARERGGGCLVDAGICVAACLEK